MSTMPERSCLGCGSPAGSHGAVCQFKSAVMCRCMNLGGQCSSLHYEQTLTPRPPKRAPHDSVGHHCDHACPPHLRGMQCTDACPEYVHATRLAEVEAQLKAERERVAMGNVDAIGIMARWLDWHDGHRNDRTLTRDTRSWMRASDPPPAKEDEHIICPGCKKEADPTTCCCGEPIDGRVHDNHYPVPMGCRCLAAKEGKPDA